LTAPLFTSTAPFEPERVHAVAIYCSDGRFGDAVDEFLHDHLGLPNYDRLAIAGGPAWLTYRSSVGLLQYGFVREQLDFMVQQHGLQQAVLIAHHGCAHYLRRSAGDAESALPIQIQDLRDAAAMLRGWHPSLRIETFLARVVDGRVQFEAAPDD
jgi:hypothetical protein